MEDCLYKTDELIDVINAMNQFIQEFSNKDKMPHSMCFYVHRKCKMSVNSRRLFGRILRHLIETQDLSNIDKNPMDTDSYKFLRPMDDVNIRIKAAKIIIKTIELALKENKMEEDFIINKLNEGNYHWN